VLVTFDTETHLIRPGQAAPRMVCVSISYARDQADVIHRRDPACKRELRELLETPTYVVGGHNAPYDLAVTAATFPELLVPVFALLDSDRLQDSQHRQKLIDIAEGKYRGFQDVDGWVEYEYNLAALAKRFEYPMELDKDTWRLRYHELDDVPVGEWDPGAVEYSRHDALAVRWVIEAQAANEEWAEFLPDQYRQGRAAFALTLMSAWGIRTDEVMVARYRRNTEARLDAHEQTLLDRGFLSRKEDGTFKRNVKVMQEYAEANLKNPKRTPAGRVELSEDAVKGYTDDPIFAAFQEYGASGTVLGKVVELEQGTTMPIHTRFDELMASGRTSSSKPNTQARWAGNDPTESKFGDRECFVPRKGNVFLIVDVPGLELSTIAQKCKTILGYSKLGDDLLAGNDPHARVAAAILGISYEEAVRRKEDPNDIEVYLARQGGKIVNFGRDAMIGPLGLTIQARTKYDIQMTLQEAKGYIAAQNEVYPEIEAFHRFVQSLCGGSGYTTVTHLFSDRVRGWVRPTEACNTFSQGLGADATKEALYELTKECYIGAGPLLGSRPVDYIHDEYIVETREENLDAKADSMGTILVDTINTWLPDVPINAKKMKPLASRRWSKLAQRKVENGKLQVWEWDQAVKEGSLGYAR
jgi:hypothetical protein